MKAIGLTRYLPITDDAALVDVELPRPEPAGRDPAAVEIGCYIPTCVDEDVDRARAAISRNIATHMASYRFYREYYETSDGLRMTVDTGMAYAPLAGRSLETICPIRSGTTAVVELKYPLERQPEAIQALRRFPFRATRFSKYVIGIDHLLPQ